VVLDQLLNLDPVAILTIVLRCVVVYFALLGMLRLAGKRELGQMTPFDLVVLLIIANAVQNAMVGPDTSLSGGLIAAFTLISLNWIVNRTILRSGWLRQQVEGSPTLLVNNGVLIREHLEHEGLTDDEVLQALREHGVDDLQHVKTAVLEVDGTISVVPADAPSSRTRRRIRGRKPTG
jgi:uncharacterized membrane protein YcaP (DUF421 family)